MEHRLAAVLISDIEDYTKLMEVDTDGTVGAWSKARDDIIEPTVTINEGRIVKFTGDGFLAEFKTIQKALETGIELQNKLSNNILKFRMAVKLGDIVDDGRDIHGEGINIAARLEGLSEPGGICISGDVYNQVKNRIDAEYQDLGLQVVKNVSEPVQAYAVRIKALTTEKIEETSLTSHEKPSIAVLPFDNMSGDSDQEYFSDGITEDIITALSHLRWLNVIARNSSFTYKGQSPDIRQVADELNCRYVLEGSIRKAGNRVRINAQLLEGLSGNHIWAEKYDRELEDIFDLQDEITDSVLGAIEPNLISAEIERAKSKPPDNLDAYDLFLQSLPGIYSFDPGQNKMALDLLHKAVEAAPDYAKALAYTAWGYQIRASRGWEGYTENDREKASQFAIRALGTKTEDPQVLLLCGFVLTITSEDPELGILSCERVIRISPNMSHWNGFLAMSFTYGNGDLQKAKESVEKTIRVSPRDPLLFAFYNILGLIYYEIGELDKALEYCKSSLLMNPSWDTSHIMVIAILVELGDIGEAEKIASKLLTLDNKTSVSRVDQSYNFPNQNLKVKMIEGLRRAGIPES
ncbi:MAG: adenylate/guanylate cyclase domain-containing protein [Rhodospirillaceae bacterium]|nr:adenylate/guanylate cyclase domain-containing protein [Rhodospirillaceae bacterium]